ncbi:MAG: type II secretion system protein [Candidatus Eisenbacteria bacterium]
MSGSRGFTLIELMIALVIAGVVLSVGMPAFGRLRDTLVLRQAGTQLLQDVRRARQLAVTRRAPVVIKFGTPPSTTDITTYEIHVDTNADNVAQTSETRTLRQLPRGTQLDRVTMISQVDTLTFDISGTLKLGTQGGTLVYSNPAGQRDSLVVSAAGICYHP